MYQNKRPLKQNHIPDKLMYKSIKNFLTIPNQYILEPKEQLTLTTPYLEENIDTLEPLFFNHHKETFEEKIEKLEQQQKEIFTPLTRNVEELSIIENFLYHGIRFQNHLEKLEKIFQDKAILAANYQKDFQYTYDDNCNEGEYISLAASNNEYDLVYKIFILENISLVISSECNAIKTIYLPYEEWIKLDNRKTKNRYSYATNEYQVKKEIPLSLIKAIGIPTRYLNQTNKSHLIDIYLSDILELMKKYNIDLPIVDTTNYNYPLYTPKKHITKKLKKRP